MNTFTQATKWETEQIAALIEAGKFIAAAILRISAETEVTGPGSVRISYTTNDDNDDGYPDGKWVSWEEEYSDPQASHDAVARLGVCRIGVSGVIVTVIVDGMEIR